MRSLPTELGTLDTEGRPTAYSNFYNKAASNALCVGGYLMRIAPHPKQNKPPGAYSQGDQVFRIADALQIALVCPGRVGASGGKVKGMGISPAIYSSMHSSGLERQMSVLLTALADSSKVPSVS